MILKLVKAIFPSLTVLSFSPLPFISICFIYPSISPSSPPDSCSILLPFQTVFSLCCQPMFSLFQTQSAHHPLRALGMQVLGLLSLCGSLSVCMKMNFYGLLIDCPLLYISSLAAIVRLIAYGESTGLCGNPFSGRSLLFLVNSNTP